MIRYPFNSSDNKKILTPLLYYSLLQGMKFRVYLGAIISLLDTYTDFEAIVRFFKEGNTHFAYVNMAFVAVSVFLQLLTAVLIQNRKRGTQMIVYESLIVISMLKPAVDAKRLASGDIQEENTFFSHHMDATVTKGIEMFGESFPSSVLQTYALIGSGELSAGPVTSIAISACSIAYSSTIISLDFDTDPANRLKAPSFYGYCPDNGRLLIMILMVIMSASHVLLKVIACSLILRLSSLWFIIYMSTDQSMFFLYKLLRGDLRYWLNLPNILSWVVSFVLRGVVKTITDFTLLVQFRHPSELGGMYWSLNIVANQMFCFISVYLYRKYSTVNMDSTISSTAPSFVPAGDVETLDGIESHATTPSALPLLELVFGLFFLSMFSFGIFLSRINKEYLVTFFDTRTGSQFLCHTWRDAISDEQRFNVFSKHRSLYKSINKELKDWLSENWDRWEEENEEWFTAKMIGKIPDELLPEKFTSKLGVGAKGRRKSIVAMMKAEEKEEVFEKARRASAAKVVPSG